MDEQAYNRGMETKTYIWIGIFVGGIAGGALGNWIDHGSIFGLWSILLSGTGSVAGIIAGYKFNTSY